MNSLRTCCDFRRLCRVGTPIEEIVRHLAEAGEFGQEDIEETIDQLAAHIRTGGQQYYEHTRPDGTVIDIRSNPLPAGGLVATFLDATERKHREQALHEAQENYRHIFENATFGIYRVTPHGRPIQANPALAQLNRYDTQNEFLASVVDVGEGWYVEPGRHNLFLGQLFKDGIITSFESEIRRHKTGERIWVSENAWVVRGEDGEIIYYEGTVQDITKRRVVEEQARRHEAELARVLRLSTMGEMATALSHQLNQPLVAVANYTRGSLRRIKSGSWDEGEIIGALEAASNAAERAGDTLRGIRRFVQRSEPQRQPLT